jgi:6-phosphogluconolactonase (cycloisomerase 2 family)
MDLLHVYAIDSATGHLSRCPSVNITFGSGPRHGVFWTDGTGTEQWWASAGSGDPQRQRHMWAPVGKTLMYLVNEIGGTMMVFDVAYSRSGCMSFYKKQTLVPYTNGSMPEAASPSEIRQIGDTFYVSVRSDGRFPGKNDSMVTLDHSPRSGLMTLRNTTPAYGKVPRTFAINRAGDLVAIGNQASATVVVVRRDRETGNLGEQVAILQVGEPGKVGTAEGLSSVIWDE